MDKTPGPSQNSPLGEVKRHDDIRIFQPVVVAAQYPFAIKYCSVNSKCFSSFAGA